MWFRIELNKDRSVKSCVEVESSLKDGRSVHYIEADSKAEALRILAARYDSYLAREKARHLSLRLSRSRQGMCIDCGREPQIRPGDKGSRCQICIDRMKANRFAKGPRIKATTDEEKAQKQISNDARRRREGARYRRRMRANLLRAVLSNFDTMRASEFRAWLISQLDEAALREVA